MQDEKILDLESIPFQPTKPQKENSSNSYKDHNEHFFIDLQPNRKFSIKVPEANNDYNFFTKLILHTNIIFGPAMYK